MSNIIDFQKKKEEIELIKKMSEQDLEKYEQKEKTLAAFRKILETKIVFD